MKKYLRNRLCIPVKGFNRAIIYDLIRNNYFLIPIELFEIIKSNNIISFDNAVSHIEAEWYDFLIDEEIIFEIDTDDEKKRFPKINTNFYTPFLITDIIIHDNIRTNHLQLFRDMDIRNASIIVEKFDLDKTLPLLQEVSRLEIDSINLLLIEENINYSDDLFDELSTVNQLFNILLFKSICTKKPDNKLKLINIVEILHSFNQYSKNVFPEKLNVNFDHFFESYNHHNYFNQKVYIDKQGNIKNGLNNQESYGNINSITKKDFSELIKSKKFQKLWNVKKVDTLVCKDCEFRYMCVDPRVPKKNNKGEWYHTEECDYNPYISKWKNEEGYKTLSGSGVNISKNGEISIDKKGLENAFESAWS